MYSVKTCHFIRANLKIKVKENSRVQHTDRQYVGIKWRKYYISEMLCSELENKALGDDGLDRTTGKTSPSYYVKTGYK